MKTLRFLSAWELRGMVKTLDLSFSLWLPVGEPAVPCPKAFELAALGRRPPETSVPSRMKVQVPTGFAAFPEELLHTPEKWLKIKYPKLISYSYMARGGHFAALEEPELLARDIIKFVGLLERQ